MRKIRILTTAFTVAGMSFFFSSCNSGDEKKDDKTGSADTSAVKKPEPSPKPSNVMIIKHKVANFAKWLPGYEAHDSMRQAYGLHNYVIGRGVDDSNMVMVAVKMDDAAKAKVFAAMPGLKEAMQKSGVVGPPTVMYYDVQMMDSTTNASTTRVMVTHKVKDFDAWKKEFDSHKQARMDAGLTDRAVGYEVGNNKMVNLVFVVGDMKKAKDFFTSKDLKDKMAAAGVDGPPTVFFYNVAKKY